MHKLAAPMQCCASVVLLFDKASCAASCCGVLWRAVFNVMLWRAVACCSLTRHHVSRHAVTCCLTVLHKQQSNLQHLLLCAMVRQRQQRHYHLFVQVRHVIIYSGRSCTTVVQSESVARLGVPVHCQYCLCSLFVPIYDWCRCVFILYARTPTEHMYVCMCWS